MREALTSSNSKPSGVEILIILAVIGGVIDIVGAAIVLILASASLSWLEIFVGLATVRLVFSILSAISILLIFYGMTSFLLTYGLWKGRGWAWTWALASAIVGLAASSIALGVGIGMIGVASNALAIYYLTRTEVKAFFGKAHPFCHHCGNRFNRTDTYCSSCGSKSGVQK